MRQLYLENLVDIRSLLLGSLHILVTSLSRTTKIIFYVCLLTHFARQNGNLKNKQNHATKVTKIQKSEVTKMT